MFGHNKWVQIGISCSEQQLKPFKLVHKNTIIDIASHSDENTSISLSIEGTYNV